jgi:hypothetical protein
MSVTGGHVNVPGPPIPAGQITTGRSGGLVRATPGRVASGIR